MVALAGGSTPRPAYERIASTWKKADGGPLDWSRVHLFWGDERHVPPDDPRSNYRMTNEALIRRVPIPQENVHPVHAALSDPGGAARDYEERIRSVFQIGAGELPSFDLILLGMGPDGHIASLFPGTKALDVMDRLVVENWIEAMSTWRITLTLPVLNHAAHVMVLVAGREKAETLRRVTQGPHDPPLLPAERLHPESGSLVWLADQEAAP
jgi:6-phosphogluconolactonase